MSEIRHIRKRITGRKQIRTANHIYKPREKNGFLFAILYTFAMFSMVCACLALGFMINQKQDWVDLSYLQQTLAKTSEKFNLQSLTSWLPFESWFHKTAPVSTNVQYDLIQDHYYTPASGNQVQSLLPGIVLYIGQQESGEIVMVKHDNGVLATYGALEHCSVKLNDRLLQGAVLGGAKDNAVYLEFSAGGQEITMQEALSYESKN